jgi:signal transduction histidine kinase/integral membrane sensor domain MASE1/ActR/RegA family two-component response regulator
VIALSYFALVYSSLRFIIRPIGLTIIWPAIGLSLAALVCSSRRSWPLLTILVFLATTLANYLAGNPLLVSFAFAVANVVEVVTAATVLYWGSTPPLRLQTLRDILRFVLVAPLASNALTALLGAAVPLFAFGTPLWTAWRTWWVADALGMLVIGTLIVIWRGNISTVQWNWARWTEAVLLVFVLLGGSLLLFGIPSGSHFFASPYLIFPLLMWAALRFGLLGASAAVTWISVVVVLLTINNTGLFVLPNLSPAEQALRAQLFLFVMSLSTLTLAAVMGERQEAQEHLIQTNLALEQRVAERTNALTATNLQLQHEVVQRQAVAQHAEELRAEAQTAREHLERVLTGISDQILMLDPAWRFVFVNDRVAVTTGRQREAFLGHTIWEVFPSLAGTVFEAQLRQAVCNQMPAHFVSHDPSLQRWFEHRAYPSASGLALFSADITERKRTEQMIRFLLDLDAALAQLANADVIEQLAVTQLGTFLDVTRCFFARITDRHLTVLQVYQRDGSNVLGNYDQETFLSRDALAQLTQGHTVVVHDVSTDPRTAMATVPYQHFGIAAFVTTPVLYQGRWVGALGVVNQSKRDWRADEVHLLHEVAARTWPRLEQARTQAALRASEAKLQVLYEQEQAAHAQAEEASRVKDEFLALVSHELRTPLTAFLGYAQLLHERPCDDPFIVQAVDKLFHSARMQAQLIDDLLDMSRIVNGKLRIETHPLELRQVIHAALDIVRPTIEAKRQHLHIHLPAEAVRLKGDPNRLQQIVWNLLANAAKFTPLEGTITLRVEPQGREVVLTISDTGQGIRPDFLPFVFERFRQAEGSSNRRHRGLGLGLAIVRQLVELHGGTVEAASPGEGQGATVTVRLPRTGPDPPLRPGEPPSRTDTHSKDTQVQLRGIRVLLVDDDRNTLEVVRQILSASGALVRPCTTARKAFDLIVLWRPEVLVSDIGLPDEDGYWLLHKVRALPPEKGGATPAIALTAYVQKEDRLRALAAGFQGYVLKPVEPDELRSVIADLVGRSRQDDEAR